jgi:hypothetical protein
VDVVTSFIREPFVEGDPRDSEEEHPVQTGGMGQALGELVTCSRCVGTWAAAGLATAEVLAPRFGRLLTWTLAVAALNDFLQGLCGADAEGERTRGGSSRLTRPCSGESRFSRLDELDS